MNIINKRTVQVFNSNELSDVLEYDNGYNYIYLGSDITLENGININENKKKIIIDGTYNNVRHKLTGMNSEEVTDTFLVNLNNEEIKVKNMDIEYTNPYGVMCIPMSTSYNDIITTYENINFNGTQLSFNPYGTTKIVDSIITIKETNGVAPQEVCESDRVILGGNTTISSNAVDYPLFQFKSNTASPSVVFLCKSDIRLSSDTREFMNGTNKLNFTILHDTSVNLVTGNGFAAYTIHGANNVLIDERASLIFIENKHQRIPMWSVFGNFTMREGSTLQLINSYDATPSDNYNIHFKGNSPILTLDNPKEVVIYTKNANVIYTNNPLTFNIKCKRLNMWTNSTTLTSAGGIDNLPDYYWYKEKELVKFEGTLTSSLTAITNHNLTRDELSKLSDIGNFSFQSRKQFSIGSIITNIHQINSTRNKISGHTTIGYCDVLIKYSDITEIVSADSDGLFEYQPTSSIPDNTTVEIISNNPSSFIYETRVVTTPYNGELSLMDIDSSFTFLLTPISINPIILPKNKDLVIKVVDSRANSSEWKLYAYISKPLTSQFGFVLEDALIFKKFDDTSIILDDTPKLVYTGQKNDGDILRTVITCSKEKGPLLDLSNNALEINEEYFSDVYFTLEE